MSVLKLFALWYTDDQLQEHPTLLLICEALDVPFMTWVDVIAIIRISLCGQVPSHFLHHCDLVSSLELAGRNFRF